MSVAGVGVDVLEERRLGADLRAGVANPPHGLERRLRAQLGGMVEVGHEGELQARIRHLFEEAEQVVGVVVVEEAVRPVGDRLRADADGTEIVSHARLQQRLNILPQVLGLHDQRVAAGEEDIADLVMGGGVSGQAVGLAHGELFALHAHELRPAEAEGAISVARLPLAGEEEHGLAVLVLHPFQRHALKRGHVVFFLAGRVWVQRHADLVGHRPDLVRRQALVERVGHAVIVFGAEHIPLGEGEPEHAVVGGGVPIDEMVDDILVRFERQHVADDGCGAPDLLRHRLNLGQLLEVVDVDRAILLGGVVVQLPVVRGVGLGRVLRGCGGLGHASPPLSNYQHRGGAERPVL